jgi:hypothetical protein
VISWLWERISTQLLVIATWHISARRRLIARGTLLPLAVIRVISRALSASATPTSESRILFSTVPVVCSALLKNATRRVHVQSYDYALEFSLLSCHEVIRSTCGLVAMTSASHAEGRQFDPGQVYAFRTG